MILYAYLYTQRVNLVFLHSGYFNLRFWGSKSQKKVWQTIFLNSGHPNLVNQSFKTLLPRNAYRNFILWNFDRTI